MHTKIIYNKFYTDKKEESLDDLITDDFYKYSNSKADLFYNNTYGVNDIFNNVVQHYLAAQYWMELHKPTSLDASQAELGLSFYLKDICVQKECEYRGVGFASALEVSVNYFFTTLCETVYFTYLMFKIPYKPGVKISEQFAVLRHKGAIKKFKRFEDIPQEYEDIFSKDSIYRLFPLSKRLAWLWKAYAKSFITRNEFKKFYIPLLGKWSYYAIINFYKKRIVYAEFYKLMLDDYFYFFEGKEFYTGNNLDRYSVIEDQLAKKHNIRTYNIPHGIEYGFKFPKGFSSDIFYAHSQYAADYLNKLYKTSKYVYNEDIIGRMFRYSCTTPHDKMVIFFTEPREVYVNIEIIKALIPRLKERGVKFYIKLHPGDNKEDYSDLDVEIFTEYEMSLTGNICISRKSTILLEAIHNNSVPIAIITNTKDQSTFNQFPALNSKEIIKTFSIDELFKQIIKYY